ncbi:unnamed protein product [Orchesella dallaii]|uniref:Uncharacterized protein n=1 Tax=Orchesella dallaii TaxID=48710 RepID=A0ABP1RKN2_9HEXA
MSTSTLYPSRPLSMLHGQEKTMFASKSSSKRLPTDNMASLAMSTERLGLHKYVINRALSQNYSKAPAFLSTPANKSSLLSEPGLGGCGDEPHAANVPNLYEGGSGVGKFTELSVSTDDDDDERIQEIIQVR